MALVPEEREQQRQYVQDYLRASAAVQLRVADECAAEVLTAAGLLVDGFRAGGKVLLCGNGGSAADAQHLAGEFVSLLSRDFVRPGLSALALTTDTSFLTAYANDFDFLGVFERQVDAHGRAGDVLVAISTSGNSANVERAVGAARRKGISTIGLLGEGGRLTAQVDCAIVVPSRNTQYVQESMLAVEHLLCYLVERAVFGEAPPGQQRV